MIPIIKFILLCCLFMGCKTSNVNNKQSVRVMSFNIRYDNPNDNQNSWDNRKTDVVNLIQKHHPDFLGVQEALWHQVEFILQNNSDYQFIGKGREDGNQKGEFSPIFFNVKKFELVSQKTFWLSPTPDSVSVGWDAALKRVCTYGQFKNKQTHQVFHVFNAHFDHQGAQAREKSAELIVSKINEWGLQKANVIVMGDFNCLPDSKPIAVFSATLNDAQKKSKTKPLGARGTFNYFDPNTTVTEKIDYIFTLHLITLHYEHLTEKRQNNLCISDHLPILAVFE